MNAVTTAELDAYVDLLRDESVLRDRRYPVQIVWGANDPALKLAVHGEIARRAVGLEEIHSLPAKHFLQEDQAQALAARIARLATS